MEYYQFSTFKKMKPESLKMIYDSLQDYPSLLSSIINELQTTYSMFDLKLGTATRIFTCCYGVLESFNEYKFIKLFN